MKKSFGRSWKMKGSLLLFYTHAYRNMLFEGNLNIFFSVRKQLLDQIKEKSLTILHLKFKNKTNFKSTKSKIFVIQSSRDSSKFLWAGTIYLIDKQLKTHLLYHCPKMCVAFIKLLILLLFFYQRYHLNLNCCLTHGKRLKIIL